MSNEPTENSSPKGRRVSNLTLRISMVILAIMAVFAYINTSQMVESHEWVTHTHEVIESLENTMSSLVDAETGTRGFVITHQNQYLEPYNSAISRIDADMMYLFTLTKDNQIQQKRLLELKMKIGQKLQALQNIQVQTDLKEVTRLMPIAKVVMDDIRRRISDLKDEENRLLNMRMNAAHTIANRSLVIFPILIMLDILVTSVSVRFLHHS